MTSLKTSIKTITYLSDIGCLEIQWGQFMGHLLLPLVASPVSGFRRLYQGRGFTARITGTAPEKPLSAFNPA